MPRPKNPPNPTAERAARLVALLSESPPSGPRLALGVVAPRPSDGGEVGGEKRPERLRTVDVLAAKHRARRRASRGPSVQRRAAPVAAAPPVRTYTPDGPTGSRVFNAFLNELPGSASGGLREVDVSRWPSARLAMFLFDVARRFLPRMASAAGDTAMAMELLPLVDPCPDGRDPGLYTRAAAQASGDIGAIARDFEAERASLAEGRGDRELARSMLAALAGSLVARAAQLLGHIVYADMARALDEVRGPRRRAPVRRSEAPAEAPRRPASKTG